MPNWDEFAWAAFMYGSIGGDIKYQTLMQNTQILPILRISPMGLSNKMVQDHLLKGFLNAWKTRVKNSPQSAAAIKISLNKMLPFLTALSRYSITGVQFSTSININNQTYTIGQAIGECYGILRNTGFRIGPTATAKLLHVLRPSLFVMWDGLILKHFKQSLGIVDSPSGYLAFLNEMQNVAGAVQTAFSAAAVNPAAQAGQTAEDYLSFHLGYWPYKTMAKFLDEFYWVTVTNNVHLPPRWNP